MHVIGQNVDLTYPYNYLGQGAADLGAALKDKEWMQSFKEAKFPMVLVGPGILQRPDRDTILQQAGPVVLFAGAALLLLLLLQYCSCDCLCDSIFWLLSYVVVGLWLLCPQQQPETQQQP